ncbi:MAG: hypothetical protein EA389_08790 [Ilumatobacter sp.]|nr:MAG: hypothetical protein EA389_08790 [Ilumatobacter sp.]
MRMNGADRRRVVLASAITVLALPSLLLMNRDEPTGPATVAPGGIVVGPGAAPETTPAPQRALGTAGGAYLQPPEIPAERPRAADEPLPIAVPAQRPGAFHSGRATYRSTIPGQSVCLVANAPQSARVTITNRDNGRSFTCIASVSSLGSRDDVVLHTDAFTRIADLTDAPIPVEITW